MKNSRFGLILLSVFMLLTQSFVFCVGQSGALTTTPNNFGMISIVSSGAFFIFTALNFYRCFRSKSIETSTPLEQQFSNTEIFLTPQSSTTSLINGANSETPFNPTYSPAMSQEFIPDGLTVKNLVFAIQNGLVKVNERVMATGDNSNPTICKSLSPDHNMINEYIESTQDTTLVGKLVNFFNEIETLNMVGPQELETFTAAVEAALKMCS